ncbi:MAG TPA: hypothetical protein VML57_08580 [Burkholderiales bacterium]|nr:hypothetical protein [Burkholderiales bacterium]
MRERETAEETRELAGAIFAERDKHCVLAILMWAKDSRPIFKVVRAIPGLRIVVAAEDRGLQEALAWLRSAAA